MCSFFFILYRTKSSSQAVHALIHVLVRALVVEHALWAPGAEFAAKVPALILKFTLNLLLCAGFCRALATRDQVFFIEREIC
jgi:hypothetical protein